MKITLVNQSGCSFTFNDIPEVNNAKEMKDYLWTDISVNHLFKSREDLDNNWEVKQN